MDSVHIEEAPAAISPQRMCKACEKHERKGINPLCDLCSEILPSIIIGEHQDMLSASFVQEILRRPMKSFAVIAFVLEDYGFADYAKEFRELYLRLAKLDGELPFILAAGQEQK